MILHHNARHRDDPKPLPMWITESPNNYATLKRPLPESKTDSIFIYDKDCRCDPWDEPTIYDANALSFKIQITNPQEHKNDIRIPPTTVTNPKKNQIQLPSNGARRYLVYTNRCRGHHLNRRQNDLVTTSKTTKRGFPSPPPQTAHTTDASNNNKDVAECPQRLPYDLNINKEFIQHDKDDDYIPLMSANTLKKRKRMFFIPLELQKVKIYTLVDSGAYINA